MKKGSVILMRATLLVCHSSNSKSDQGGSCSGVMQSGGVQVDLMRFWRDMQHVLPLSFCLALYI